MKNITKIFIVFAMGAMTVLFQNCANDVDLGAYTDNASNVDVNDIPPIAGSTIEEFKLRGDLAFINAPLPRHIMFTTKLKTGSTQAIRTLPRPGNRVEWRVKGSSALLYLGPNPNPADLPLSPFNSSKAVEYEVTYINTTTNLITRANVDVILDEASTTTPVTLASIEGTTDFVLPIGAPVATTKITLSGTGPIELRVYKLNSAYKKILPAILTITAADQIADPTKKLDNGSPVNLNLKAVNDNSYGWYRLDFTNAAGMTSMFVSLTKPL